MIHTLTSLNRGAMFVLAAPYDHRRWIMCPDEPKGSWQDEVETREARKKEIHKEVSTIAYFVLEQHGITGPLAERIAVRIATEASTRRNLR